MNIEQHLFPLVFFTILFVLIVVTFKRTVFGEAKVKVAPPIPIEKTEELRQKTEELRQKIERIKTSGVHLLDAIYELQNRSLAAVLTLEEIAIWVKGWHPTLMKERLPFIVEPHLARCNISSDFDAIEKAIGTRFNGKILGRYSEKWLRLSQNYQQASERFRLIGETRDLRYLIEHFGFQGLNEAGRDLAKIRTVSYYFKFVYVYDYDWGNTHCPVYDAAIQLADKIMANDDALKIPSSNDFAWLVGILRKTTVPTEYNKPVQALYTSALNRAIEVSRGMELPQVVNVIEEAKFYWSQKPVDAILENHFRNASLHTVNAVIREGKDKRLVSLAEERRKQLLRAI